MLGFPKCIQLHCLPFARHNRSAMCKVYFPTLSHAYEQQASLTITNNLSVGSHWSTLVWSPLWKQANILAQEEAPADAFWLMESFGGVWWCVYGTSEPPCWGSPERTRRQVTLQGVITSSTISNTITSVLSRKQSPASSLDVFVRVCVRTNRSSYSSD